MSQQLYQSSLRAMMRKVTWMGVRHVALTAFHDTNYRMLLAQVDKLHAAIGDRDVTCDDLRAAVALSYEGQLESDLASYVEAASKIEPAHDSIVRGLIARELAGEAAERLLATAMGDVDLDTPSGILERARDVLDGGLATPVLTLNELDMPSAKSERGRVIPLGISKTIDEELGGAGAGELICILAPPRRGKTTLLRMIGANMVKEGYNVLDLTLETAVAKIGRLYERAVIHRSRKDFTDQHSVEARRILGDKGGNLWLKDLSHTDVTPDSIEALIRAQQRNTGQRVDAVILDYLELMSPAKGKMGDAMMRYMYGRLGKQMRAVGRKFDIPIITAWQVNREGSQVDTITEAHISECWDLFKHVDMMIALNRTSAEKANHTMRLGILKQREDDDAPSTVEVYCNYQTMTIHDLEKNYAVHQADTARSSAGPDNGISRMGREFRFDGGSISIHSNPTSSSLHSD